MRSRHRLQPPAVHRHCRHYRLLPGWSRTQYGNRILSDPSPVTCAYNATGAAPQGCGQCSTCPWDAADAAFKCSFVRYAAGTQQLTPYLLSGGAVLGAVPNGSFAVTVVAGPDSRLSTPIGGGATTQVGGTRVLFVQARDAYNNSRATPNAAGAFELLTQPGV